jgi:hypothetical protein
VAVRLAEEVKCTVGTVQVRSGDGRPYRSVVCIATSIIGGPRGRPRIGVARKPSERYLVLSVAQGAERAKRRGSGLIKLAFKAAPLPRGGHLRSTDFRDE